MWMPNCVTGIIFQGFWKRNYKLPALQTQERLQVCFVRYFGAHVRPDWTRFSISFSSGIFPFFALFLVPLTMISNFLLLPLLTKSQVQFFFKFSSSSFFSCVKFSFVFGFLYYKYNNKKWKERFVAFVFKHY